MNGASRAWTANERSNDEYGDGYDIEDMDQDDVGTFTGLALDSSETDEVSCLMSVRGVEDTWNGAPPSKKVEPETAQTIAQTTQTANETFAQTTQFTQSDKSTQSNPNINVDGTESTIVSQKDSLISAPTLLINPTVNPINGTTNERSSLAGTGSSRSLGEQSQSKDTFVTAPTILEQSFKNARGLNVQTPMYSSASFKGIESENVKTFDDQVSMYSSASLRGIESDNVKTFDDQVSMYSQLLKIHQQPYHHHLVRYQI